MNRPLGGGGIGRGVSREGGIGGVDIEKKSKKFDLKLFSP